MITKEQVEKFLEDFSLKVKILGARTHTRYVYLSIRQSIQCHTL